MLKPYHLIFFPLSAHHYHDVDDVCWKWCECISNFEIPVWGKNVIVNLLNLSKNLIYNKNSFYASIQLIGHQPNCANSATHQPCMGSTELNTIQTRSVHFKSTESAQIEYLHLIFFDEQIAFIPSYYAVITMNEMKWNEMNLMWSE